MRLSPGGQLDLELFYFCMDHNKELSSLKDIIRQLVELDRAVKVKLHAFLKGKDHEQVKDILRELDKNSLHLLCEMSLPEEDYEICHAVQEVLKEKDSQSR
jgi:hypothetical protein